jgi:hypothetical protein
MPGIPQDQIDVLLDGFRRLLQAYRPADPDDAANPADAFFLYRVLLGRNPDPTADLPWLLSDPRTFRTEAARARLGRVRCQPHLHPAAPVVDGRP